MYGPRPGSRILHHLPSCPYITWAIHLEGEGKNFEQSNFRMANILNVKINERSNIEWPILRESL